MREKVENETRKQINAKKTGSKLGLLFSKRSQRHQTFYYNINTVFRQTLLDRASRKHSYLRRCWSGGEPFPIMCLT